MNTCMNCSKETNNPKFCSRSCAATLNNKEFPKRKTSRKCSKCENVVKTCRHMLCEDHFEEWKLRFQQESTVGEYRNKLSVKGKHPSWSNAYIRNFTRSWLKHLRKLPCAFCGYDKHVELAHIKPVVLFEDDCKLSEVNSESNVVQLCPNCHWEFDNLDREMFNPVLESLGKVLYEEPARS